MAAVCIPRIRDEISLVLDKFILQEELADYGLTEDEIIRPRCPSDVVADADIVTDAAMDIDEVGHMGMVETDGIESKPARLDREQEKQVMEIVSILRKIGDEFSNEPEKRTRRFSITDINVDELKLLVDTQKFNQYMEKHVNSYDPNLKQVAQVCHVTKGLIQMCRKAHQAVSQLQDNATNFMYEKYGEWLETRGGMIQAVRTERGNDSAAMP